MPADAWDGYFIDWLPRRWHPQYASPWLTPEMLPVTTWQDNVRTRVSKERWDDLRKYCYKAAGNRCEICGVSAGVVQAADSEGNPVIVRLECHEDWGFNDNTHVQKLKRLLALCPLCHKAKHLGFAKRVGMLYEVLCHIKSVNGWTDAELMAGLAEAETTCTARSEFKWTVDISWLETYRVSNFASS